MIEDILPTYEEALLWLSKQDVETEEQYTEIIAKLYNNNIETVATDVDFVRVHGSLNP